MIGAITCITAAVLFVIGVGLWIAVGVVVSDPPNGSKYALPCMPTRSLGMPLYCGYASALVGFHRVSSSQMFVSNCGL